MKISTRNMLKGTVNDEVIIELPDGAEIVSIITKHSAENLGLVPGKPVYAVFKASSVLVMADWYDTLC